MNRPTALIVGAGIGGLAAGVALRRIGWHVRIFERSPEPRALGFALNLAPNARAALAELGVADRLAVDGCVMRLVEVRRGDGSALKRLDVAAALEGAAAMFILRPALHDALLDAGGRSDVVLGSEAVRFDVAGSRVVLTLRDGRTEAGDILIGADGAGSVIRRQLHPDEPPPRHSGYFAIRGLAYGVAECLQPLSVVGYLGDGIEAATAQAGEDAVYWYVSLLADDARHLPDVPSGVLTWCATLLDDGFHAVVRATRPEDVRVDELFDRDPILDWGAGPVTLLGDAAHPMLPQTGQGAAQALEDAIAVSLALAAGDTAASSLRRYEKVRARRTRAIVKRGRRIAKLTTTRSRVVQRLREAALRIVPARAAAAGFLLATRADPHRALRKPTGRRLVRQAIS